MPRGEERWACGWSCLWSCWVFIEGEDTASAANLHDFHEDDYSKRLVHPLSCFDHHDVWGGVFSVSRTAALIATDARPRADSDSDSDSPNTRPARTSTLRHQRRIRRSKFRRSGRTRTHKSKAIAAPAGSADCALDCQQHAFASCGSHRSYRLAERSRASQT